VELLLAFLVLGIIIAAVIYGGMLLREELRSELQRRRVQEEVARATSRLRRLEHDAMRQMHEVIDVEGREA
jgi:uncharacterized membrane protein YciS (DUF1049 family)